MKNIVTQEIQIDAREVDGNNHINLWAPLPQSVNPVFTVHPDEITFKEDLGSFIAYWDRQRLQNGVIRIFYEHDGVARVPPTSEWFLGECLETDRALIEDGSNIQRIVSEISYIGSTDKETVKRTENLLTERLRYEYPAKVQNAEDVLHTGRSDCGGYHAAFVAILRQLGIPAIQDFGYRGSDGSPHSWAWWFDRSAHAWTLTDLNDLQRGVSDMRRVSMTLGTSPKLNPEYPRPVVYLQGVLGWCESYDEILEHGGKYTLDSSLRINER